MNYINLKNIKNVYDENYLHILYIFIENIKKYDQIDNFCNGVSCDSCPFSYKNNIYDELCGSEGSGLCYDNAFYVKCNELIQDIKEYAILILIHNGKSKRIYIKEKFYV